jgi:hypothetical protein
VQTIAEGGSRLIHVHSSRFVAIINYDRHLKRLHDILYDLFTNERMSFETSAWPRILSDGIFLCTGGPGCWVMGWIVYSGSRVF